MSLIPFIGPTYKYATAFDNQRTVNLYPIVSETQTSKSIIGFQGTPGLTRFLELPNTPIRGTLEINGRAFAVAANKLYEIFIDGTFVDRGTLDSNVDSVSMATNGFQLCIVDGPNGYIFTLATNAFQEITDPYFLGAITVTFDSGYFIFNKPDSQIYYLSSLYDGLTGDPLDFASAEGSPDNLVAVITSHQQVWLMGTNTVQIVYNSGGADFPYSSVQGSLIQYGCIAPFSLVQTANTVFWLGRDGEGNGMVWMANGLQPQRISTHAIEERLQGIADLDKCVSYTYQENGYYFYCLNVPSLQTTFCYEVKTNQWHERAEFVNGQYERSRPNTHMFVWNSHLVGDYESGIIYKQSLDYYDFDTRLIRRMRTSPHYFEGDMLNYIYYHQFQLDMQVGIGVSGNDFLVTGGAFDDGFDDGFDIDHADGLNPDVYPRAMLQWSNDGGYTWSNEYWVSVGRQGEYKTRAVWRRLGRARNRVYRVAFTGKCPVLWNNAYSLAEKGTN